MPISWKRSQSVAPVTLAAMCCTELGFQNGNCVLTMSSWEIMVMKLKYLLLRRQSMFEIILSRTCYLFNKWKLGNWHNATMKYIDIFKCLLMTTVSAAYKQRAWELDHFLSPSETRMYGLADCCKSLWCTVSWWLHRSFLLSGKETFYNMISGVHELQSCYTDPAWLSLTNERKLGDKFEIICEGQSC